MKLVALLLLGVVALAGATRVAVQDREFAVDDGLSRVVSESQLRAILEALREVIGTGDPDNGIPVLDPFELDKGDLDIQILNLADIKFSFEDLVVRGLQGFVVNKIKFVTISRRLDFDITIPSIKATVGLYGNADAKIKNQAFSGNGDGSVEILNLRVHGSVTVRATRPGVTKVKVTVLLGGLKSELTGLQAEGAESSEEANKILEEVVVKLVKDDAKLISKTIEKIVYDAANDYLKDFKSWKDVLG